MQVKPILRRRVGAAARAVNDPATEPAANDPAAPAAIVFKKSRGC
jgi:hypothetical protein